MAQHLSTECPEELVACTYAIAGCQEVVKRNDLQRHLQDKDQHLDVVLRSYVSLTHLVRDIAFTGNRQEVETSCLPLTFKYWLQNTPTCYPRLPWVFKMEGFQEKKQNDLKWFTDPVYFDFGGYKMCLSVYANGYGAARGSHVSVFINMMRGDNDDNLKWPFKGTITVSLLNQLEDRQHYTEEVWLEDGVVGRVTVGEMLSGIGLANFIHHKNLNYRHDRNCQILKDDILFFELDDR